MAHVQTERGNIGTSFLFVNLLHVADDTNTYEFIDSFTLKEFIHLLE